MSAEEGRVVGVHPSRLAGPLTAGREVPDLADLGLGWLEAEVTQWKRAGAELVS